MDRTRWAEWVSYPSWPCPTCQRGNLRLDPKSSHTSTGQKERRCRENEGYNHDEHLDRVTGHLICDHKPCGETATLAGDFYTLRIFRDGDEDYLDRSYRARSIIPSPLPFPVGPKVPKTVEALIREAAALYWMDPAAAVTRVREAIEAILSDRGTPELNAKGKRLRLHERIEQFRTVADGQWSEQADIIEAAKWIGNEGTHEAGSCEATLDAFEMLETALEDIYVRTRHTLLEKVRTTNARARQPKAPG